MSSDSPRRRRRHLYAFALADDLGPLYAIYPLWFAHHHLSVAQISVVFILWGAVELASEVPSGALADLVDRRRLLAIALLLRSAGIVCWLVWPSFTGILVGAALWALHSALASGSWEALVYDHLAAVNDVEAYPVVMARIGQASHSAIATSTLLASALIFFEFSLAHLLVITLGLTLPAILLVLTLPRVGIADDEEGEDAETAADRRSWWATMRQGVRDAHANVATTRLALLGALLGGLFIVDEYIHLLGRERGAPTFAIPLIVAAVWAGLLLGGELAARRPEMKPCSLGALLGAGSLIMAGGLLWGSATSLLLVAVGYGALQTTWVISDARFQASIPSSTRATVTSVRALGSGLCSLAAIALIGAAAIGEDPTPGLVIVAGLLALAGFAVVSFVPAAATPQGHDATGVNDSDTEDIER